MTPPGLTALTLLLMLVIVACTERVDCAKGAAMTGGDPEKRLTRRVA